MLRMLTTKRVKTPSLGKGRVGVGLPLADLVQALTTKEPPPNLPLEKVEGLKAPRRKRVSPRPLLIFYNRNCSTRS